jgi:chromosome segregation ATPase
MLRFSKGAGEERISPGYWVFMSVERTAPEEAIRERLDARGGKAGIRMQQLMQEFGLEELDQEGLDSMSEALEEAGIGVTPPLHEVDADGQVTLHLNNHQQADERKSGRFLRRRKPGEGQGPQPKLDPEIAQAKADLTQVVGSHLDALVRLHQGVRADLEGQREELVQRLDSTRERLNASKQETKETAERLDQTKRRVAQLETQLKQSKEQHAAAQRRGEDLDARLNKSEQTAERRQRELEASQGQGKELTQQLEAKGKELEDFKKQARSRLADMERERDDLVKRLTDTEHALGESRRRVDVSHSAGERFKQRASAVEQARQALRAAREQLESARTAERGLEKSIEEKRRQVEQSVKAVALSDPGEAEEKERKALQGLSADAERLTAELRDAQVVGEQRGVKVAEAEQQLDVAQRELQEETQRQHPPS